MKTTQELLKKIANLQALIPPQQKLDLLRFIKDRQMSRSIELTGFQIIASNVFILRCYFFMGLYNPYWTRKTQGLCKPNWNRRAHLKCTLSFYLNKEVEKENLNLRKLHKVFLYETLASSYGRKSYCCVSCTSLGFVTKQNL